MSNLNNKASIWANNWVPRDSIDAAMQETIIELLAENERLKQEATANAYKWTVEARRAEIAEARYKALCETKPVAVVDREAVGRVFWLSIIPDGTQLIPRPSMEG